MGRVTITNRGEETGRILIQLAACEQVSHPQLPMCQFSHTLLRGHLNLRQETEDAGLLADALAAFANCCALTAILHRFFCFCCCISHRLEDILILGFLLLHGDHELRLQGSE